MKCFEAVTYMPCSECVKTGKHCCKADVPFGDTDVKMLQAFAEELNIGKLHPVKFKDRKLSSMRMVLTSEMLNLSDKELEVTDCVFLKEGLCQIYENRPSICRTFGTRAMPCTLNSDTGLWND